MAATTFTGRKDPFEAYAKKPNPDYTNFFQGVDLSGIDSEASEAEEPKADLATPDMPPPVAGPQPAAMPETEAEKVARVRGDLFAEPEDEDSQFTKGVIAGTQQMLGLYGAGKAAIGSLIDSPEMVTEGIAGYQKYMKEAEKFSPNVSGVEDVDLLDEGGMERLGDYLGYTFGNVLPSMAISIGTGGVSGVIAGSAARYLGKEGAQEALEALAKKQAQDQSNVSTVLKKLKLKKDDFDVEANERLQALIKEDMGGAIAKDAAARAKQDYISAQAFKYGLVGSGSQSVVLNTGETFGEIYERTGEEAPVTAIAAGIASGALDTFATPLRVAKALTPNMLDPMRDHLSKEALRWQDKIGNVLVEVGKTGGIEGMTEASQAIITELAVNFVNNNYTNEERIAYLDALSSEEATSRILNSAAAGVVGGAGISAGTQAVAAGVDQLRGREPQGDVRQQLIDDRLARMDAIRQSVREIVEAEFTDINEAGLPAPDSEPTQAAPEPEVQAPAPVTEARFDEVAMDTLRLIGNMEGITEQELVETTGLPMERQQQVISDLFTEGAIEVMVDGNRTTFAITDEGTFDLYPPEFEEPELTDLPPVDVTPAATTTIETDAGIETREQTLEEFREQGQQVAEPEAPARQEPIVSAPTGEPVPEAGIQAPTISAATDTTLIEADRRTPVVSPLTDANRVIEKPKIERTSELGGGFSVTYPGSKNKYLIKQYAQDAGGGFYLVEDGKTTDLADTLDDSVKALEATERRALSTGTPVETETVQPDPIESEVVQADPAESEPTFGELVADNSETLSEMAKYGAGWEVIGGKGVVSPEGESLGRTPWVPREEWFREAQQAGQLADNTNGDATRQVVAKAISGEKLKAAEIRHVESMLLSIQDMADEEQRYQDSVANELSATDPQFSLTEGEYDDALTSLSAFDSNDPSLSNWDGMTEAEKDAELDNIFGASDGRQAATTEREGEAPAAIPDQGQADADQRELAPVRQSDSEENARRESAEEAGDLAQLPEVTRPTLKRYKPSGPVQEGTNQFQITFPDSNNQYIVERIPDPVGGDAEVFVNADSGVTLGASRTEMMDNLILQERRLAASTPAGRVTDPTADPVVKKDADFRETGNYSVTYPDGDVRGMFFNQENPRAWFDSETVNSGSAGDISTGVLGYNKAEALARLKEIRQQEFDQQNAATPADDLIITTGFRDRFGGVPDRANQFSGALTSAEQTPQTISQRITNINLRAGKPTQVAATGDSYIPERFGSMSLLMRTLDTPTKNPQDVPRVTPDGQTEPRFLEPLFDEYPDVLDGGTLESSPEVSQYVHTLLDLVEQGMPVDFVTNTNGVYVNPHKKGVLGSFYPSSFAISINQELLESATTDAIARARLSHVVAHEHWHLADEINGYSGAIQELGIKPANPNVEIDPVFETLDLELGDIAGGLFDQWARGTELGQEFHYPFASLGNAVADEIQSTDSAPLQERVSNVLRTFEKEVFAQAGAVFIGNPQLLKAESPSAYNLFRAIQKQPKLTAGQLNYGQGTTISGEERESGSGAVSADFRSRTRNRSVQIPVSDRGGQDSGGRSVGGQGLSSVEGSPRDGDGDASGRGLRETPALDVREDQKYLYQKPRGKVRGKFAINKKITPANSAQQLQLLSELVARHPNALDSAAKYTAFEKDLTGGALQVKTADGTTKETLVLRPPHYLIKLYNDMDLWVETHSKLRGEQLAAASAGLETAQKMGKLYADGDATPATTAKLMLWGMLSRMLTASAQESAFVDLMTKLPGQNFDPVNDLVQKALTGGFTDENVTVTVVTDKSKGTTKEVTMNRAEAEWRESVSDMIPEGSFGKSGTSNANDFGSFMLKMSEMDGNQSKLARLHDLVSDRSISTARVRQEFQSMMGGAGIDNKVFSFLMLMTGRDDVVILDRIQLNTMWDTGRYGKLIYDDIAENFSNLHGLARYEVLENAIKQKIVELYTRLGRPQDASVGRYHWESWVLNSGQVVAHPTMQGLVADIMGAPNPYAFMGAPEGKQNMYRYGAIYARDDQGQPYYLYADSKGTPYKLDRAQFGNFLSEIQKPKNGIVPRNFKVSEYDEGFPWYEADGVDRAKLDEVLKANAEREATQREYSVTGDVRDEVQTDGTRQGLEPTPSLDVGVGFRGVTEQLGTRNQLVADLERADIPQGELVADITDADLDAMSPDSKRLLKALQNDDWLGFDNIDDLLVTIFDEGLDGYDTSISTRIALGRYVNQNYGGVSSALDMVGDNPNKDPSSKFNEVDAVDIVKDLQYRLEKILPFYKGIMDQYVDMKQLERQIAANRGLERLPAAESFYDAENLMHGKAAYEIDLVQKKYLEPITKILSEKQIDVEGLGKYLLAKHAPERNVVIAQKALEKREKLVAAAEKEENQRVLDYFAETPIPFQDYETNQGGSGISNQEAIEILAIAESDGLTETMDEASQLIYDMLKEHRDRMVKNQLLDFETVEDWEGQYKFYVPLKGFAAEENIQADYSMSDKTRGFSIMGSESLKAKGRTTLPSNPVIISILDVATKIKRGEKNKVANVLLDMLYNSGFETDPDTAEAQNSAPFRIWTNKKRPDDPATQGSTQLSLQQMDRATNADGSPRYVRVKRGGKTFYIEFTDPKLNQTIQKLGESPLNTSSAVYGSFANYANKFQNYRRSMLINYNPAWGITAPIKDVTTAIFYSMSESGAKGSRTEGKDVTAGMVYNYPNALRAYWRHLKRTEGRGRAVTARGKEKQSEYDRYVTEYFEDGAPTGMVLTRTYDEEVRAIENDVKGGNLRRATKGMGKFVEDFNQTMENAARVSAYVEARKAGAPRANAATLAKDLTVNFNRKGEINPDLNLLWLFFNAAQQGTQNFVQAVGRHSKKIPAALVGLFGAGYTITVYNILNSPMDEDEGDDEPFRGRLNTAEYFMRDLQGDIRKPKDPLQTTYADYNTSQLKRTINITREDGTMVSIPLAYGFQFIYNGGRTMAEWQYGLIDENEAVNQLTQSFIDNFSPFDTAEGKGAEELRGIFPDVGAMIADIMVNKNYFGSPIQREQFPTEPKQAQVYVTKQSTSKMAKDIAQRLNDIDGDEITDSAYYPYNYLSPDRADYIAAWFLGGVGRFIGDLSDVAYKAATDPEAIELTDYPVVGQFYKEPSEYKDQMEFYENSERLQSLLAQYDSLDINEDGEVTKEEFQRRPELKTRIPYYDSRLKFLLDSANLSLRELRKTERAAEQYVLNPSALREKLEKVDEGKQKIYDTFNKAFRAAKKKAGD